VRDAWATERAITELAALLVCMMQFPTSKVGRKIIRNRLNQILEWSIVVMPISYVRLLAVAPRKGQGLVEYALILVLVSIVVIVVLLTMGRQIKNVFSNVVAALG
jgi:pilus assembly protein Flp/PilA